MANTQFFCKHHWDSEMDDCRGYTVLLVLTILMLIIAVIVFGVSAWAIATNSHAIHKAKACLCCCSCCHKPASVPQAPIVIYLAKDQVGSVSKWRIHLQMSHFK